MTSLATQPPKAALGTSTHNLTPPALPSQQVPSIKLDSRSSARSRRYALQDTMARILPEARSASCMRSAAPERNGVTGEYSMPHDIVIDRSQSARVARYKNVMRCKNVWVCPVCASIESERRAHHIRRAVMDFDYDFIMITYTFSHKLGDDLDEILSSMKRAYTAHNNSGSAPVKRHRERFGWVAHISATEITYGHNGFHPHVHQLVALDRPLDDQFRDPATSKTELDRFVEWHKKRWLAVLQRHGLSASHSRGIDVRTSDQDVARYISKWGLEEEMSKSQMKQDHNKDSVTMFGLLTIAETGRKHIALGLGPDRAAYLFRIFYESTYRKKQLVPSRAWRDIFGSFNSDGEADEIIDDWTQFMRLPLVWWSLVVSRGLRGELLDRCAYGDVDAVWEWLFSIRGPRAPPLAQFDELCRVVARLNEVSISQVRANALVRGTDEYKAFFRLQKANILGLHDGIQWHYRDVVRMCSDGDFIYGLGDGHLPLSSSSSSSSLSSTVKGLESGEDPVQMFLDIF